MEQKQVQMVAKIAANQAVALVREQITDLVQYETMKVLPQVEPENIQSTPPRYNRGYVTPLRKPLGNFGEVIMRSVAWRMGRGEQLGVAHLAKPGTKETLLVEQYGNECSVLRRDDGLPKCEFQGASMTKEGVSPWVQFDIIIGQIDHVVSRLLAKGWQVKKGVVKAQQELLTHGVQAAQAA